MKMNKRKQGILFPLVILGMLISMNHSVFAQGEELKFTLEEAKTYAVKNSYQSRLAAKDVEKSERKVKETISTGLPQVNATGNYQQFLETPIQLIPGEAIGMPQEEFVEVFFGTEQSMGVDIKAEQLIFDGSYFVGLQAAKVYLELSKNDLEKSENEIKNLVTQAYGNVLVAEKNAEILKGNRDNLDKMLFETSELYENGFREEQDRDQIKLSFNQTQNQYDQAVRQIDISRNQLKLAMGISIEQEITLSDKLENITIQSKNESFLENEFKIDNHIDYRSILTQENAGKLLWKQQKSTYLPKLNAFYSYQQNSFSNEFDFFSGADWFPTQLVGLSLNVPIFSSFGRHHRIQQAKIDVEKIEISKMQLSQKLKIDAANAKSNYALAIRQYENANENLALAESIYDKTEEKYKEGMVNSLELTQSNNQLLESQGAFIKASFQLINSKVELDKALNNY